MVDWLLNRGGRGDRGSRGGGAADAALFFMGTLHRLFLVTCQIRWFEAGSVFGLGIADWGLRGGVSAVALTNLYGEFYTGEFEILVQVEKSPAPESEAAEKVHHENDDGE